jgi:hypothetical protein
LSLQLLLRTVCALAFRRFGFELSFPDKFCIRPVRQHSLRTGLLLLGRNWAEEIDMPEDSVEVAAVANKRGLTLDWWAVLLALGLALLVRVGVLRHISW